MPSEEHLHSGYGSYPPDLTDLVLRQWGAIERACGREIPRPSRQSLELVLSASYQASLFREEERPVTFRLALAGPSSFAAGAGPPTGLHRLVFNEPRPLDQHELRRLSPAAAFARSFIGAQLDSDGGPSVWGLIHSGPNWLQSVRGGRETLQAIPPVPTIAVTGPGRVLVDAGPVAIADLINGSLIGDRLDVFDAPWLHEIFSRLEPKEPDGEAHHGAGTDSFANVEPAFLPSLAGQVLRRMLAGIRVARHGGMLLVVPERRVPLLLGNSGLVRVKYEFADEEPRRRLLTVSLRLKKELAGSVGSATRAPLGWTDYAQTDTPLIKELDTALFEVAHLIADLAQIDGAVVLTDRLDVIGFGGEIGGNLPEIVRVAHAVDLEGHRRDWVRTDREGTRHRSAYRLCHAVHDVLAIVVSQDGGARFVRWHEDGVTFWDQVATGPWEAW